MNPDAPKGGEISEWSPGSFDSFNPYAIAGNAGDFLDPVFSSGVMFALESGSAAARVVAAGAAACAQPRHTHSAASHARGAMVPPCSTRPPSKS